MVLVLGRLKAVCSRSVKLQGTAHYLLLFVLILRLVGAILVAVVPGRMRNVLLYYNHSNVALLPDSSIYATMLFAYRISSYRSLL